MILQLSLVILGILIAIGIILGVFREDWLSGYLLAVSFAIAFPLVILLKIISALFALVRLFWELLGITLKAGAKTVAFVVISAIPVLVIGLTYFVPHVGRAIQKLNAWLEQFIDTSSLISECRYSRRMMVEIVAEQDDRTPRYELEDRYREELVQVKESGQEILSAGESVLSLFIGGGLLVSQLYNVPLKDVNFYGFTADIAIQIGLFVIAVSILYRVSILDFLSFNGEDEFSSLEEFDAALSYQKGVSRVGFIQILTLLFVLAMRFTKSDRKTVRATLALYYDNDTSFIESMTFAWETLRAERSGK